MNADLPPLLRCPVTGSALVLAKGAKLEKSGSIREGVLVSKEGTRYPIRNGIPRFVPQEANEHGAATQPSVVAFGDQWNRFNYTDFAASFKLAMHNTFGDFPAFLKGKIVIDAGAGAGMQTRWMAEAGAKKVIALELSQAVDGVISHNLKGLKNVDIIQCSIDAIPLKTGAITGLVLCHNVIQHTPSVPGTLAELWRIAAPKAEVAFNCYTRTETTVLHRLRNHIYRVVRAVVSRLPMGGRLVYAHLMSTLRFVPLLGVILEKMDVVRRGPAPQMQGWAKLKYLYKAGVLNTYDYFGAHAYQHHHTLSELKAFAQKLSPKATLQNGPAFFTTPQPSGIALRLLKTSL